MKPVAIFRFSPGDEPGRFAQWLDANARPWKLIALHAGEPVPADATEFAGIGMMGGPMSVNDSLPWVAPMESLLRDAVNRGVPVIGHCLGGQMLAKALGASVGSREDHRDRLDRRRGSGPPSGGRVVRRTREVHDVRVALRRVYVAARRQPRAHECVQRKSGLRDRWTAYRLPGAYRDDGGDRAKLDRAFLRRVACARRRHRCSLLPRSCAISNLASAR